jgi:hypothetical protein
MDELRRDAFLGRDGTHAQMSAGCRGPQPVRCREQLILRRVGRHGATDGRDQRRGRGPRPQRPQNDRGDPDCHRTHRPSEHAVGKRRAPLAGGRREQEREHHGEPGGEERAAEGAEVHRREVDDAGDHHQRDVVARERGAERQHRERRQPRVRVPERPPWQWSGEIGPGAEAQRGEHRGDPGLGHVEHRLEEHEPRHTDEHDSGGASRRRVIGVVRRAEPASQHLLHMRASRESRPRPTPTRKAT